MHTQSGWLLSLQREEALTIDPYLSGAINFHGSTYNLTSSGILTIDKFVDSSNSIYFINPADGTLSIAVAGSVGIGATNKLSKLTVVGAADETDIGGTTTANATTTITGSGTEFLSDLGIGDRISLSSAASTYATVTAIASDTSLTVSAALGDGTSQTINVKHSSFRIEDSANAVKMVINDQGNVGIGTTTPGALFHSYSSSAVAGRFTRDNSTTYSPTALASTLQIHNGNSTTDNYAAIAFSGNDTGGTIRAAAAINGVITARAASTITGDLTFQTINAGTGAEVMRMTSGGNVGIGTTGPDRKLDVLDASNPQLRLTQADGTIYSDFQMTSSGDLVMNVDGVSNQLVLDNGGNVGIGTTAPGYKLEVAGTGYFSGDLTIDNSAGLIVGGTSQQTVSTIVPEAQILGTGGADSTLLIGRWAADANTPSLRFIKSRSATIGGNGLVSSGDNIGGMYFYADDGTNYDHAAAIINAEIDGATGLDDLPGRLVFSTTADGANSATERMRINSAGNVGIGDTTPTEATLVLGSAGAGDVYLTLATTGTTNNVVCWDNSGATLLYDCDAGPFTDYAEIYPTDPEVDYGEIVSAGTELVEVNYVKTDKSGNNLPEEKRTISKLIKSHVPYQSSIIGITSQNYSDFTSTGHGTVDESHHPLPIALSGRVPVKISPSSTSTNIGDPITSSSDPGKGMKAVSAGRIVGTALESWTPDNPAETIMLFVNPSWYDPDVYLTDLDGLTILSQPGAAAGETPGYSLINAAGELITRVGSFARAAIGTLKTGVVVSPLAEIAELHTDTISPLSATSSGIMIKLSDTQTFGVYSNEGTPSATFDSLGNATISGNLTVGEDATVSGTLYADRIVTRFGELTATETATMVTNITNITESSASALLALGATTTDTHVEIVKDITLTESLAVFGDTLLGQTMIAGGLLVDGTITVANDSIETVTDTLYIQKNRLAALDIMGGTLVVTTQGDVMITGNLDITGNITLKNSFGSVVASLDQEGNATFSGSLTVNKLRFDEIATDSATLGASVGRALLTAGSQTAFIANDRITDETLIYLTPLSSTGAQSLYVSGKTPGQGFTVALDAPLTTDVEFNWWIVN